MSKGLAISAASRHALETGIKTQVFRVGEDYAWEALPVFGKDFLAHNLAIGQPTFMEQRGGELVVKITHHRIHSTTDRSIPPKEWVTFEWGAGYEQDPPPGYEQPMSVF